MEDFQYLWNQVKSKLQEQLAPQTYEQTFSEVKYVGKVENNIGYVIVPNDLIKKKLNHIFINNIQQLTKKISNKNISFKFVLESEIKQSQLPNYSKLSNTNLNSNFTFSSFVVGESNKFAYLTAENVAAQPGTFVNPLYIFGGVGLGKTHLMQAIGNYIIENNPESKLVYVQANDYLHDYTKATRDNNMKAFEEKYENIDVFLIDDIQMLTEKNGTQQQFFKLFNDMSNHEKQIVITSDCPASKLNGFMDRLTSRFQMGLSVNINQPDLQQRINIIKKKLEESSNKKLDDDIILYIAESFTDNVRELEGALNRVILYADLYNTSPTLSMARDALEVLIKAKKPIDDNPNYEDALSVIANMYNITIADILGNSRLSKFVLPRHIAMYILKNHYNLKCTQIAKILNNKDHTTILNGCKKISNELETNEDLKIAIDTILKKCR